jgi:hypothetical protein
MKIIKIPADDDHSINDKSFDDVVEIVRDRIQQMVLQNPWLTGRIVRYGPDRKVHLWIPQQNVSDDDGSSNDGSSRKQSTSIDNLLVVRSKYESTLRFSMKATELSKEINDHKKNKGLALEMMREFDQPVWRVSLVEALPTDNDSSEDHGPDLDSYKQQRLALVVSMSHVIGDGHTFYSLHNMLLGSQPIYPLEVTRLTDTTQLQEIVMGGKAEAGIMHSWGLIFLAVRGAIQLHVLAKFLPGKFGSWFQTRGKYVMVDQMEIQKMKSSSLDDLSGDDVQFVSSNDIITSWILSHSSVRHGLMALNFRGRLSRLRAGDVSRAGNYENCIYYRIPEDTCRPSLIRQSILEPTDNFKRAVTTKDPISMSSLATSNGFALVTNWASFADLHVQWEDDNVHSGDDEGYSKNSSFKLLWHMPVYDVESVMPSNMTTAVLFKYKPDQLACVIAATQDRMDKLVQAPFWGEVIE